MTLFAFALIAGVTSGASPQAGEKGLEGELVIFHAGSLSVPFKRISELFNERHPGVRILAEAAGSRDSARKVSDLGRECDVFGSADYRVVENLLMPEYADFNIRFARNEMVIAFNERSNAAEIIRSDNWFDVLLSKGVIFGRSDSNRDPCGYRTVMLFQLAEVHYSMPGLAGRLEKKGGKKYIRPKATDLLALLEMGELDYIFIYRSVAIQHGLKFILLPDEVNLKSPEHGDFFSTASVLVTGRKPGEFFELKGEPMVYSVTIPRGAPHRQLAEAWVALLLSPEGSAIMRESGQPTITPALTSEISVLPELLKPYCIEDLTPRDNL